MGKKLKICLKATIWLNLAVYIVSWVFYGSAIVRRINEINSVSHSQVVATVQKNLNRDYHKAGFAGTVVVNSSTIDKTGERSAQLFYKEMMSYLMENKTSSDWTKPDDVIAQKVKIGRAITTELYVKGHAPSFDDIDTDKVKKSKTKDKDSDDKDNNDQDKKDDNNSQSDSSTQDNDDNSSQNQNVVINNDSDSGNSNNSDNSNSDNSNNSDGSDSDSGTTTDGNVTYDYDTSN